MHSRLCGRCAQARAHMVELVELQGQLTNAAAAMAEAKQKRPVSPAQPAPPRAAGTDGVGSAAAECDEATSGPPSTGARAVHDLVESAASLLESSLGDELFLVSSSRLSAPTFSFR
jgi:hypothetical protein